MLTDRQSLILATIVKDYAKNGKAVGSKTLLQDLDLGVSSATIRNEMAVLEDRGLLQKSIHLLEECLRKADIAITLIG
ncbi:Heat-inducible transcription repressor HrcA [Weissella viridescens]|uniref:Heat-inducible transcription repressor HrcA n=1 Tax=Weissella viridescens TaxID=1629 RepID=A0A380P4E5_WEIVI|nr:Heat-inducible transcription repressor HrcA [Weissella viridescens]